MRREERIDNIMRTLSGIETQIRASLIAVTQASVHFDYHQKEQALGSLGVAAGIYVDVANKLLALSREINERSNWEGVQ